MPSGALLQKNQMNKVVLRLLETADCERLFSWRNTPEIIALSSSQKAVTIQEHSEWFGKVLSSPNTLAFVIGRDGQPIGHLRIDRQGDHQGHVSVYLVPAKTGCGLGVDAIRLGCAHAFELWPSLKEVVALVREENRRGCAAFAKAGFSRAAIATQNSHIEMILGRSSAPTQAGDDTLASPMFQRECATTAARYRELLGRHGTSYKALDWGSETGQQSRFAVLASVGDLTGCSVLDVGCGLGDLAAWLDQQGIAVRYTGLDLTPELIAAARQRYPGRRFLTGSILDNSLLSGESFDYVLSSGIFYTYVKSGEEFMRSAIEAMWRLARYGCGFNALSQWAERQDAGEYYADPCSILSFCRELTPFLRLYHDYHTRDFSCFLYRTPRS